MSSPLTLENSLILACARTGPDGQRIEDLVQRGPDWHAILRRVERWGMVPLVYTNLRQAVHSSQVPIQVMERLRNLNHRDTIHGVARRELLRTALLRFSESGVPVIVLKGAALAALVYPFPALRPMRDIDLLVHRRDMERVEAVLHSLRDAPAAGSDASSGNPPLDPKRSGAARHTPRRFQCVDRRRRAAIGAGHSDRRLLGAGASRPDRVGDHVGVQPRGFAPVFGIPSDIATGFVGQVRTLCDIGELCRCYRDTFGWGQLVARACIYDIQKPLYYALRLAREMVGAAVPSGVLRELRASFGQLPLEEWVIAAVARRAIVCDDQETPRPWKVYRLCMRLLATCCARDGITLAYHRLARPSQTRLRRLLSKPRPRRGRFWRAQLPATAIVLPIYRPRLEGEALAAVDRAFAILRHGDWYLIAPQSLDTSFYEQRYGKPIVRFPDACLDSVQNYSRLLLTDEFYAAFAKYEYMLITQDDVYVLRDDLPHWLSRRLDYIGAPWPKGHTYGLHMSPRPGIHSHELRAYVGNGGFSLRRVVACRRLFAEFPEEVTWWSKQGEAEDLFFAMFGQFSQRFVLPNLRMAAAFAWEVSLDRMYDLCQGQLPMAIHGYLRHDPEFFQHTILPAAVRAGQTRLQRLAVKPELRRMRSTAGGLRAQLPATAIVLPIYRPRLEGEELAAVGRAFAILRHGDWYLIAPQSLDTSFYEQRYGKPVVRFPDSCLASVRNYSRLLLTDEFYAAFTQYEYILVMQDDVYVVRDDLPYWLPRRFDYIGAPWPDGHDVVLSMSLRPSIHGHTLRAYVGNGGFSLRRITACRQLLAEFPEEAAETSVG